MWNLGAPPMPMRGEVMSRFWGPIPNSHLDSIENRMEGRPSGRGASNYWMKKAFSILVMADVLMGSCTTSIALCIFFNTR